LTPRLGAGPRGRGTLSTPSLGITDDIAEARLVEVTFNSLSRDHRRKGERQAVDDDVPFNSLSRDHIVAPVGMIA